MRTLFRSDNKNDNFKKTAYDCEFKAFNFFRNRFLNLLVSVLLLQLYFLRIFILILQKKPKYIVITNAHLLLLPITAALLFFRKKIIIDHADLLYFDDQPSLGYYWEKFVLKSATKIIVINKTWCEYIKKNIREDAIVIKNCVEEKEIEIFSKDKNLFSKSVLRKKLNINGDTKIICATGGTWIRKIHNKKVDIQGRYQIFLALAKLIAMGKKYFFIIIGSPLTKEEKIIIEKYNLEQHCKSYGNFKYFDDLHKLMLGGCDIFVVPSVRCMTYTYFDRYKFIDYLLAGKRILAANTLVNREVLKEYATFFEEENINDLVKKIQGFPFNNYDMQIGKYLKNNFLWPQYLNESMLE